MDCEFIEIGPGQNFFIGGVEKLIQWSVGQQKVTKDYGHIMPGLIKSMALISDKNYLFLSDD
jgi:WD40 repeat protein